VAGSLSRLELPLGGADCVWFQISINDSDQRVKEASMAPDPKCDGPNSRDSAVR
jgi:hypothetical protein